MDSANTADMKFFFSPVLSHIGTGESNAVPRRVLIERTGLKDRALRKEIERLRRSGELIAACDTGYFIPVSEAELQRYITREERRAKSTFYTLKAARTRLKELKCSE